MDVTSYLVLFYVVFPRVNAINNGFGYVSSPDATLKYVVGIYRHGIRSPLSFDYKDNPNKHEMSRAAPAGKGHLTLAGKRLMYDVGRFLRARYDGFLRDGGRYDPGTAEFSSTPAPRNLLSARLVTAGLFAEGPGYPDLDNGNVNQHDVPISTKSISFDKSYVLIHFPKHASECKYLSDQFRNNIINSLVLPKTPELVQLLSYLKEKTRVKFQSFVSLFNIWDRLECERLNGLELPEWTRGFYPEKMLPVVMAHVRDSIGGTPLMVDLSTGLLFTELHRHLNSYKYGNLGKIYLHASHENTIYEILYKLEITNPVKVEVGDLMLFEVHEIRGNPYVKIYYYVSLEKRLSVVPLPGCGRSSLCPLATFRLLAPAMAQEQWRRLCRSKATKHISSTRTVKHLWRFAKELFRWYT